MGNGGAGGVQEVVIGDFREIWLLPFRCSRYQEVREPAAAAMPLGHKHQHEGLGHAYLMLKC